MSALSRSVQIASQLAPKLSSRVLASSGYTLDVDRFSDDDFSVWNERTAARQDRAWQPLVAAAKGGNPREDVAALATLLRPVLAPSAAVLEVGCGGGYISEILTTWFPAIGYTGVDISSAMIELARQHYPHRDFRLGSAYGLEFADSSIDAVIDGVALLHMPKWKTALAEYARVSREYVVLHGLTLTDSAPTTRFAKYAYGQLSLELVFNRAEVLAECEALGMTRFAVEDGLDYDLEGYIGIPSVSESWAFRIA